MLEMKISKLKDVIGSSRIIDGSKLDTERIQILNKIKIRNTQNNATMQYTIVSDSEADLKQGKIAVSTPIARGLIGKKVGDHVEIRVPSGVIPFEIIEISR
jgi:transcription elongation factor GreA